jgi:hypothetical protein
MRLLRRFAPRNGHEGQKLLPADQISGVDSIDCIEKLPPIPIKSLCVIFISELISPDLPPRSRSS